jgi:hypothetical protein
MARVRSIYVRFNFKAAILSDEKQERLVSVLMDAYTGSPRYLCWPLLGVRQFTQAI